MSEKKERIVNGQGRLMGFARLEHLANFGEVPSRRRSISLQGHFDEWAEPTAQRAGVPAWLAGASIVGTTGLQFTDPWDVRYVPDALGVDASRAHNFVFELKFAPKYEFAALAQCLHHAHSLSSRRKHVSEELRKKHPTLKLADAAFVPVVVTQWNAFLRGSAEYLQPLQLAARPRFLEVMALSAPPNDTPLLWFSDPTDELNADAEPKLPSALLGLPRDNGNHWYRHGDSHVWTFSRALDGSPRLSPHVTRMVCARVEGQSERWVIWIGKDQRAGDVGYALFDTAVEGELPRPMADSIPNL